jgi:aldose 1-epimerase
MQLTSNRYLGNPHHYAATQIVELTPDGMLQTLQLTHLGQHPLPYGMGQHPWFVNTTATRVQADVTGIWLCDSQYLPTQHTSKFDADKDLNLSISTKGSLINNLYDGWSGHASIDYPLYGLKLLLHAELNVCGANKPCFLMVYRPENSEVFCLEPVSHTVDAFHQPEQAGLHWLSHNENMSLTLTWRFTPLC